MNALSVRLKEINQLIERIDDNLSYKLIQDAVDLISTSLSRGLPLLVAGNGGSACDSMHIAGELVGRFLHDRSAYNVISLSANPSVLTAWSNDYDFESIFARQINAHGVKGGVFWGITTSGKSKNILLALEVCKKLKIKTLVMTGQGGEALAPNCDILISVPSTITPRIQEIHQIYYHLICEKIEEKLLGSLY
jgi:D-sedoheptulose 7-phosphate isomerase